MLPYDAAGLQRICAFERHGLAEKFVKTSKEQLAAKVLSRGSASRRGCQTKWCQATEACERRNQTGVLSSKVTKPSSRKIAVLKLSVCADRGLVFSTEDA